MRRLLLLSLLLSSVVQADTIPTPKEFLGHDVCEDYYLANYRELTAYWNELDRKSDRLSVESIGKTEDGRDQLMCVITDPANRRNLQNYRKASERLCRAKDFKNDDDARNFAKKQKSVVWIDGGLHASETLVAQHLIEMAYRLASQNDPETKRILKDCIILLAHANPDGQDWVADHYMRRKDPASRSLAGLPFLYQKYCGHDNNRDFYANNMAETRNINRILYSTWYPQIVYNHHQSAPAGTIMFVPPFRNPFNYNMDPMTAIATDLVGTHMHQRMIAEGKPGTAMRGSTLYSTWWNGGLRTTTYFHNMVGILTETFGSPNPGPLPFVQKFQIPSTDVPFPVEAGKVWHLRDSLEYEISANYAILDYASRYRERLLFDFYRAGRNSIERGLKDTWSRYPSRLTAEGAEALKKPENRDARMYVIPSNQPDFTTACKFVEKLMQCGIEVERLTEDTPGAGTSQPAARWSKGSFVIRCDQAFRPHILDMFEPQDHPNDFQYPGGPPIPPYDNAGYTLAYQMGVKFDRVLDPVAVKTESVSGTSLRVEGVARDQRHDAGMIFVSSSIANVFAGANSAIKSRGANVTRTKAPVVVEGATIPAGSFVFEWLAGTGRDPSGGLRSPRVALWDRYGGSMESGWTRYVLEQFAFDFDVVFPPDLDMGDLNSKYDCIILPNGAVPGPGARGATGPGGEAGGEDIVDFGFAIVGQGAGGNQTQSFSDDPTIPYVYRRRIGAISEKTIKELRRFVENGGHLLCIGSSALNIARQLKLPIESALVDEKGAALPNTKFYIPGSILKMKLNPGPLTLGMEDYVDAMFDSSPAFKVTDPKSADVVSYYDTDKPLRSGWAWGQEALKSSASVVDVPLGKGRVVLYGPEILFRAQSHGTFKLLFNAIFRSVH